MTSCITYIYDMVMDHNGISTKAKPAISIYKHCDGYPEYWADLIRKYIFSKKFVNGIPLDKKEVFNGTGDFIAQFIADNKDGAGDIYIEGCENHQFVDYIYHLFIISSKSSIPQKIVLVYYETHLDNSPFIDNFIRACAEQNRFSFLCQVSENITTEILDVKTSHDN